MRIRFHTGGTRHAWTFFNSLFTEQRGRNIPCKSLFPNPLRTVNDIRMGDLALSDCFPEMFDILLGDNITGRKDFIANHGAKYMNLADY